MKASVQLISALRRAADRIESPDSDYRWSDSDRCNCGILAQELGLKRETLTAIGSWECAIVQRGYCDVLDRPIWEVFAVLQAAGLDDNDLINLEGAGKTRNRVVLYLRTQAALLEEQLTPPAVQKQAVEHECCHLFLAGCCIYCSHVEQPLTAVNSAD